jgi:hypothetical protein
MPITNITKKKIIEIPWTLCHYLIFSYICTTIVIKFHLHSSRHKF